MGAHEWSWDWLMRCGELNFERMVVTETEDNGPLGLVCW
jgi:hypothetical protein